MTIDRIDHIVLTTGDLDACLRFYRDILGMDAQCKSGRYSLRFGTQKINIHTRAAEFLPAAAQPTAGALDLCFVVTGSIEDVRRELTEAGVVPETAVVDRNGALGAMKSVYLRDPDGNLIELCSYEQRASIQ